MANKKLSKKGAIEIIGHEGIVQTRYLDSVDVWTIGVGHTKAAGPPDPKTYAGTMSLKQVFSLFVDDMQDCVRDVNKAIKVDVKQTEFDALVSFHFNTGGIFKANLTKSLNAGDRMKAAAQFMNWKKPSSIIGRRKKEQKLFAQGVYSNGGKATVFPATEAGKVLFKKGKSIDLANKI